MTDTITSNTDVTTTPMTVSEASPTATANSFLSNIVNLVPIVLIFFVFYFMLIRPQMKKQKDHKSLLSSVKKGEKVVTSGGLIGTVSKIEEETGIVIIEIAPDVRVKILKSAINEIISRKAEIE